VGSGETLGASEVALGSIHLTLQRVFSTLISVFGVAFLARAITREEMGILSAITLISSFIQLTSSFGLTQSIAKYVSELKGRGEDISTHFVSALLFKIPVALLACSALFLFSEDISSILFGSPLHHELVKLAALDAFALSLSPILRSVLLGSGYIKKLAVYGISSSAARWIAIVFLIWSGYGFYGAVVGWIIGDLTTLILFATASIKLVTFKENLLSKSVNLIPSLLRFSWPLFTASIVSFLYTWYDRALVLAFLPLTDLGVYDVSYKAFSVLASISTAFGSSLFPYYGMAYGRKDHKAISGGIKRASGYIMMIIFPLTLGLLSTARPAITLFAGEMYEPGWTVLAILSIFGLTYGVSPALGSLLLIYEKTKTMMLLSFISVASSLALLPLLWILGLNGLAVMRGTSLVVTFLLTVYFLSKTVKVEIDKQKFTKVLASSAVMAVVVLAVQYIYYNKFFFPIYVLIGAAVYLTGIRVFKILREADIQLLREMFGERITGFVIKILGYNREE